jgi:hypothetical protein
MPWNPRPAWRGIGGRLAVESVACIRWNTQSLIPRLGQRYRITPSDTESTTLFSSNDTKKS